MKNINFTLKNIFKKCFAKVMENNKLGHRFFKHRYPFTYCMYLQVHADI